MWVVVSNLVGIGRAATRAKARDSYTEAAGLKNRSPGLKSGAGTKGSLQPSLTAALCDTAEAVPFWFSRKLSPHASKKARHSHEKSRASQQRLERWTYRNTGSGHFVNPDLVFVVLHVQGDLSGCYDRIGGIVCGRSREGLIPAIALLGA